ncbi:hypothetical protein [Scytonema sp. NUACC26]|uniref:hypothetical protein n=1 Tax=Scytonema sp. NUACC26 TaxID=3140176 RepID=UPI0034DCA1DF
MSQTKTIAIAKDAEKRNELYPNSLHNNEYVEEIAAIQVRNIPDGKKRALIKAVLQRQVIQGKRGGGRTS